MNYLFFTNTSTTFEMPKVYDYKCGLCHKRYRRPIVVWTSCAVLHSPGSCCHYGEIRINKKGEPKS